MPSPERERLKKARGAVLALFDKSLRGRVDAAFKPKPPPKPEAPEKKDEDLSEEDAAMLAAEYGGLGE